MPEIHLHTAGGTENAIPVKLSPVQTEPVVLLVAAAMFAQTTGAAVLLAKRQWSPGILMSVGIVLTGVAAALARSLVTPMGRPRDRDGDPLTPLAIDDEK